MPLIAELPPSTLPRRTDTTRPSSPACGEDLYSQVWRGSFASHITPSGIPISGLRSGGPASIRQTRSRLSALSRLASTSPDDPAPTITWSNEPQALRISLVTRPLVFLWHLIRPAITCRDPRLDPRQGALGACP